MDRLQISCVVEACRRCSSGRIRRKLDRCYQRCVAILMSQADDIRVESHTVSSLGVFEGKRCYYVCVTGRPGRRKRRPVRSPELEPSRN